jgi:preprotein translocase subunit SecG
MYQIAIVWRTFTRSWIPGDHRSAPGVTPEVPIDRIPDVLPTTDLVHALGLPPGVVVHLADVLVLALAVAFAVATLLFLQRSKTGKAIRAVSQNPLMAEFLGINPAGTITRAFALGGGLAGAAAFIFAIYYSRPIAVHGAESGLLAFAAALLGGIGNPVGALIAALGIGVFSSFSDFFLTAQWTPVLTLALLIAVLVLRPTGLAGSGADDAPTTLRDSVILTAPGQNARSNRWLIVIFAGLAVAPLWSPCLRAQPR